MKIIKIIPCLDVKDGRVVKGIKFVNLRDARDPVEAARVYCEQGADELTFLDISATVEKRGTKLEWVKKVAEVVTVPFCVGGGIRNMEDMQSLFDLGVDKVSVNTAAVRNPELISQSAKKFGKEKTVVAIDGIKQVTGYRSSVIGHRSSGFEVMISGGYGETGLDVVKWAKQVEELGAGEILLTSKDADGTKEGYDIEMTRAVAEAVKIPVIASGGAGKVDHLYDVVVKGKASAVLCASVFHFGEITIPEAKRYLQGKGIPVNL